MFIFYLSSKVPRQCLQCGAQFRTTAHTAKWCPQCREVRKQAARRRARQKNKAGETWKRSLNLTI
jgi:hypothetical protein